MSEWSGCGNSVLDGMILLGYRFIVYSLAYHFVEGVWRRGRWDYC